MFDTRSNRSNARSLLRGLFQYHQNWRRSLSPLLLFLADDYTRAPSVNGALASGVGAAEEVAELLASSP